MSTAIEIDNSQDENLQDDLLGDLPQDDPLQDVPQKYTLMEISSNGKYLVTHSEGSKNFIEWNFDECENEYPVHKNKQVKIQVELECDKKEDKDLHLMSDKKYNRDRRIRHMCVSNNEILAYIYDYENRSGAYIEIIDMDTDHRIELYFEFDKMDIQFCNFNSKGELILWCTSETNIKHYGKYEMMNIVCVYSVQSRKTKCQKIYTIPIGAEVISISKDDKIWLRFNNNIYEWDIHHAAYTTIRLKNIYEVKDIKIFNNEEYTCFKLSNNRIIVYSNQLGFSIASFDLKYLNYRKRDKLIKQIYNLMINHPSLSCLLLSLLNNTCLNCLNQFIENSQITSGQLDENLDQLNETSSNRLNLFYRSKSGPNCQRNYRFVYHNNHIRVSEFKLKEKLKANNLNLKEEDVLGKYQLEKGSIFWKFKFEEGQDVSVVELKLKLKKIKEKTINLVKKIDNQMNKLKEGKVNDYAIDWITEQIDTFKERLKEFEDWQSDDDLVRGFEIRINEMQKWKGTLNNWKNIIDIGNSDKINKIKPLIEELVEILDNNFTKQIRHRIKIKLENYFVGQINEKDLVKSFIDGIQKIIKFENLEGNLQEKNTADIVENFDKLKNDFDDLKKSVKNIVREIKDVKSKTYIEEIDKIKKSETDPNERNKKIDKLVKKLIKVTEIEVSVKKFTKQIRNVPDSFISVELTDTSIDTAVKKTMKKFIKEITNKGDQNTVFRIKYWD